MTRAWLVTVACAFAASGIGSWLGTAPRWPDPKAWAVLAWTASFVVLVHAAWPTPARLRSVTTLVVCVGALRIAGFMFAATSTGSRWAGVGGWTLIVALAMRAHIAERRTLA